jgi:hypothetical protein
MHPFNGRSTAGHAIFSDQLNSRVSSRLFMDTITSFRGFITPIGIRFSSFGGSQSILSLPCGGPKSQPISKTATKDRISICAKCRPGQKTVPPPNPRKAAGCTVRFSASVPVLVPNLLVAMNNTSSDLHYGVGAQLVRVSYDSVLGDEAS